ncbi:MAG: anaerobic ribonucleoside triphosphate reductase [Oscillospiraceae bacterium]|jgi:ribonucleoside-triphosphate reductase|nr:anaerobic ribonucleoside triphosphate reductase [Oscillospiraceae bacterium]
MNNIIKRDGRKVEFDIKKVSSAIFESAKSVGGKDFKIAMGLAIKVEKFLEKEKNFTPTVDHIQDIVEKILIENGHAKTAKEYILYRAERTRIREMNTSLMKIYEDLSFKLAKDDNKKRENANIDGDTAMGTMLKYGSEGAKQFYEMYVLDKKHVKAHREGDIHIHDLDFLNLTTTCCQIDIDKLFTGGFSTGHGFLREPNDISSYSALACIAIQANQNDQHGGQSIPNFDYAMAKGVKKTFCRIYRQNLEKALELLTDSKNFVQNAEKIIEKSVLNSKDSFAPLEGKNSYTVSENNILSEDFGKDVANKIQNFVINRTYKETDRAVFQAMEAFVYNLNTMHSRAGAQVPFSSINYGTDTSKEGRMVIKNILLAQERGLGNGETPIFPIHIFKVKEGINYNSDDVNYDLLKLALKVSAKRLFPNFSFIDAPFNLKYYKKSKPETEVAYMGCRTRVVANNFDPFREIIYGRGNLSFTSINLPRIGIKSNKNIEFFYELLEKQVDLIIEQLLARFELQSKKKVRNFPFLMGQGVWIDSDKLSIDDEVGDILKHGTLTLGFIGLAECLKALTGFHHGENLNSHNIGLEIVGYMRKKVDNACKKYNLNFSLIATPAEGLSGRFVLIDREKYGNIKGVTDRNYYTNSFHVPVYYPLTVWDKIKIEAPYHSLTNGGHISYVELDGDPTNNLEAFEKIIRCMKESGVGYGSVNHPVDRDPVCGYTGIIADNCPSCGRNDENGSIPFERIRRITGYLVGTLDRFNDAKKAEEHDRVKHSLIETEKVEKRIS